MMTRCGEQTAHWDDRVVTPVSSFLNMSNFRFNPSADLFATCSHSLSPTSSGSTTCNHAIINSSHSSVESHMGDNSKVLDAERVLDDLASVDDLYGWDSNLLHNNNDLIQNDSISTEGINLCKIHFHLFKTIMIQLKMLRKHYKRS